MESDTLPWLALAASLVCFYLISFGEASVRSVRRERIQLLVAQGVRGAHALESLQLSPMGPAGVLLLLKFPFLASSLLSGAALAIAWWGTNWALISLVTLVTLMVLGITHTIAMALGSLLGDRVALKIAFLTHALARVLRPVLAVESNVVQMSSYATADQPDSPRETIPTELNISMDSDGEPLDEREVRMIRGVVQLDKTTAREIMVPRGDMVATELGTSLDRLAELMVESGHSRIPIYTDSLDHIQGIAYANDVLGHLRRTDAVTGALSPSVVRPALFIPGSKTLEELLNEFQERRVHMAIVVDEYGGVSGLVTIEDLLEEIVGEIRDEFDVDEPEIEAISDNEYLMDARVGIDQLYELLQVAVEGDGFDTVGGFVYQRLGKIPSVGDVVEYNGLKIEVVSTVGRRLRQLRVTRSGEDLRSDEAGR